MPYSVKISWEKDPNEKFIDNKYSRAHIWAFDGGITQGHSVLWKSLQKRDSLTSKLNFN